MMALSPEAGAPPVWSVTLWPHRSMNPRHFRWFLLVLAAIVILPLSPVLGGAAFWIVGLFLLVDLALLYAMMQLTYRSGRLREHVQLWPDRLRVERVEPNGAQQVWEANPHWVRVSLIPTKRVRDYLVLSSAGRDIELGAFLTPAERRDLADELRSKLATL